MKFGDFNILSWTQEQYRLRKEKWKNLQHRKVLSVIIISFVAIIASVIVYFVIIPAVADYATVRLRVLRDGTESFKRWEKQPLPFITNIYLWNLTNPEEVSRGMANPKLVEVGPYVYEQITLKRPLELREDSIVYMKTLMYHYRADLTAPRSLDDIVITLQAALYGAAVMVHNMAPSMMGMVEKAVPSLFPGINSIFVPVRVGDYLFDGVVLNCSNKASVYAQMVCRALPNNAPQTIRKLPNSSDYAYSFLHHKNATEMGPYEEIRGVEDIRQIAQLVKLKNQSLLNIWQPNSQCDRLRGTDTLNFAPFVSKADKIEIYIPDICQVLPIYYQEESVTHGIEVYKFSVTDWLDSKDENPDNECYCMEENERYCFKNGVRDISQCMNAPIVISHPHFYQGEAEFRDYAQGCSPDPDKHLSMVYLEPRSGVPVKAAKRIQFNMPLKRIKGFSFVENVTEGIFPLMWLEESVEIDEAHLWPVRFVLMAEWIVNFICVCVGSLMVKIFVCALLSYLYLTRACCFRNISSNRVTAIFYHPRSSSDTDRAQPDQTTM
ncbi:sensory neuron membrane protein 2-like [Macrosteles quadrilineatus]|uniref:sensory neuron membrane protein 2-like n=1 Tax=Macrosteles quadrilineatus TaxID=74068 RepID=UPI0023E1856B|nr:sensory neuron membrane protein 2-like [Macrosteles quadrilineatus]XP_054267596.1 sensory neuron membrane protein 2-like [Macrosteles quadrilineatus]XP_054267597.1 sensory neuron membrane protein 2-like [Macrosteles quadrilineatus]